MPYDNNGTPRGHCWLRGRWHAWEFLAYVRWPDITRYVCARCGLLQDRLHGDRLLDAVFNTTIFGLLFLATTTAFGGLGAFLVYLLLNSHLW